MQEVTTTPGHSGDDDELIAITEDGMTIRRPAWCRTDDEWRDYRDRMADWWRAWQDGFLAGRSAGAQTGADQ